MLRRATRRLLSLALSLAPVLASAQDAVAPPRLIEEPELAYPPALLEAGNYEHAEVSLVLEIDAAGIVVHASVDPAEPTARPELVDAALAAARTLRFAPAQRLGLPTAARIRYRFVFTPPVPAPREPPPSTPPPSAAPPAIEVTVRGRPPLPAAKSYTRGEVRLIPGAFGDPFRAVETQPGVTPIVSGLPFFYVQGAPPGNVGYLLDGISVPYLYHVGAGPAVVHPAWIDRVELHPGGYPARFGRFAGGVISATTTAPTTAWRGEATLRLFDVGALVETGFAGNRGSVLLGGRYSYTGALLSLAAPDWDLDYHDFQARVTYDVGPRDRVTLSSFGAYDNLAETSGGQRDVMFASEFYRTELRFEHTFDRGALQAAVTLGYGRTPALLLVPDDRRNIADYALGARTALEHTLGEHVELRLGLDVTTDTYRWQGRSYADPDSPQTRQLAWLDRPRTDFATGAYLDLTLELGPALRLLPGVRADLYGSGDDAAFVVEPRIAARLELTERVHASAAFGIAHQAPTFIVPLPGVTPELGAGLQRAIQSSAGLGAELDSWTTVEATVFHNWFSNLTDAFDQTGGDTADPAFPRRSRGSAYGLELSLRRQLTNWLGGFVSYTASRSNRVVGDTRFVNAFDRPHVLSAAVSCGLGRGWRTGGRVAYYSGTPKQQHWDRDGGTEPVARSTDVSRNPAFFRLDLRLEKRWQLRGSAWISLVLEFMNATLQKETWPDGDEIGPISIPSLGVEAGF